MYWYGCRDELERRQLVHTIQLLKLEVSQKQLMLETVRNEQASQVEELSERLSDTLHEKKLVTLRLQSLTHAYEQEVGSLRGRVRQLQSGTLDRVSEQLCMVYRQSQYKQTLMGS